MNQNDESKLSVAVLIIEASRCQLVRDVDDDTALTMIALVSDDPSNWDEAASVWPRYQTQAVCEFVSMLPMETIARDVGLQMLASAEAWVVIDFPNKRVFMGGQMIPLEGDAVFSMFVDEPGAQHCALSIHLPPWWELHSGVSIDAVAKPRQSPINQPQADRDFLYGDELLKDIANRVLAVIASDAWNSSKASERLEGPRLEQPRLEQPRLEQPKLDQQDDEQDEDCDEDEGNPARYPFTVQVHRDWLMTPRDDLGGRTPRQMLHGAINWSGLVTNGQQLRAQDGAPLVALPDDWPSFATAPIGSQEICIYFDLCRELIEASWSWCDNECEKLQVQSLDQKSAALVDFLRGVKSRWLNGSYEGGSSPNLIIQCDRRRVPCDAGLEIVGMEGMEGMEEEQHILDCDCPICQMMVDEGMDGMFSLGFTAIDGHHLELDDEFAFSMIETLEEWEQKQRGFAEFNAEFNREWAEREASAKAGKASDEDDDSFASAWSGVSSEAPIPGDRQGHLKMAFMVAEIISELEIAGAPRDEIKQLNASFASYRKSSDDERFEQATLFKANLQSLADSYPELIAKSADLQSRIDEAERNLAFNDLDSDSPF